jgi:hypothetical protein
MPRACPKPPLAYQTRIPERIPNVTMSFPPKVRDEALVACGRHCCLCHRFRGLKIELHHIVQQSEGGEDTLENCVPLCFDCHGDMRSYDSVHPKGTKYTPAELRGHRDRWYAKVRSTGAAVSAEQHQDLDRQTMRRLVEILPWNRAINFVRHHDFGGSFRDGDVNDFHIFLSECANPTFEFLDADIEGMRAALLGAIRQLYDIYAAETFVSEVRDLREVPPEWEATQPERYFRVIAQIHVAASQVCDAYDQLVRAGHRKLGVPSAG